MKTFRKILGVVDPVQPDHNALSQCIKIAKDHQASLTLMAVLPINKAGRSAFKNSDSLTTDLKPLENELQTNIEQNVRDLDPDITPEILIVTGISSIEIVTLVVEDNYDIVIKSAQKVDWIKRLFGSEDIDLIRKCPCPVLMLKPNDQKPFTKILATVDVNEDSSNNEAETQSHLNEEVLRFGATMSVPELSELHVGAVWNAYAEGSLRYGRLSTAPSAEVDEYVDNTEAQCKQKLDSLVDGLSNKFGSEAMDYLNTRKHLVKGEASKEIPQMAEENHIDLIVMGTVGRIGIPGFIMGNTAEAILEQVQCSVLAIKPEGFKTPVQI